MTDILRIRIDRESFFQSEVTISPEFVNFFNEQIGCSLTVSEAQEIAFRHGFRIPDNLMLFFDSKEYMALKSFFPAKPDLVMYGQSPCSYLNLNQRTNALVEELGNAGYDVTRVKLISVLRDSNRKAPVVIDSSIGEAQSPPLTMRD